MIKLPKKNKDQLIFGLIAIALTILGLWAKSFFLKDDSKKQTTNIISASQNPIITTHNSDSGKQSIALNQITQMNSNKGSVSNEFISGDKKVYNSNQTKSKKNDTQIINNGFINNGGAANTYNQTINPQPTPRQVLDEDIKNIEDKVPKTYALNITFSALDKECNNFGYELAKRLTSLGYNISISLYGILGSTSYNNRFGLTVNDSKQEANILIYVLRE